MRISKKGWSIQEMIIVMIIIAALTAISLTQGDVAGKKGKVLSTTSTLQLFATDIEAVIEDLGTLEISSGVTEITKKANILEYITIIENSYMHTYFDKTSLTMTESGFEIKTKEQFDGWDQPLMLVYNTDNSQGKAGVCMLISAGANLNYEREGYSEGKFGDDLLVIIEPKG